MLLASLELHFVAALAASLCKGWSLLFVFLQMELSDVYVHVGPEINSVIFMSALLVELLAKEEFTVDQFYLVRAQPVANSSPLFKQEIPGRAK